MAVFSELQLPVGVDEVQGCEELGFQASEALEATGDVHKRVEVFPDYLIDFPHVDDKPRCVVSYQCKPVS